MKQFTQTIELAGFPVSCEFFFPGNRILLRDYVTASPAKGEPAVITEYEREVYCAAYPESPWCREAESKSLLALVSDRLIAHQRMMFHCVAFLWNGRAWLITAPSGTGKTTQYKNLKALYPDEIDIICGDNPALHFHSSFITVHPSPWIGKEGFGGTKSAPLAGIIYLEQKKKNSIYRIQPKEAVVPILNEIPTYMKTEQQVHQLIRLEERLITSVPIWKFENTGTPASSEMLMECLKTYEKRQHHEIHHP